MADDRISTDLNVSPYYDDFDTEKDFHRILFRPATAVQARELTQLQTILQEQSARHGDFVFKQGAIVKGNYAIMEGAANTGTMLDFCRVEDTWTTLGGDSNVSTANNMNIFWTSNNSNTAAGFTADGEGIKVEGYNADGTAAGAYIVGGTSRVIKKVWYYANGLKTSFPDTNILYTIPNADGLNNGATTTYKDFINGETIFAFTDAANATVFRADLESGFSATSVANNSFASIAVYNDADNPTRSATGGATGVSVSDGVMYYKGHFVRFDQQRVIARKYDDQTNSANVQHVGFTLNESVVTPETDSSLYDNAQGSSNENAPGAHRLKLQAELKVFDGQPANNFSSLIELDTNGKITEIAALPDLNDQGLGREFARTVDDVAGDFVIGQPSLKFKSDAANTSMANVQINMVPGGSTFMVKGNRFKKVSAHYLPIRRGTDTVTEENVTASLSFGNYLKITDVGGRFEFNTNNLKKIFFCNTSINAVSNATYGTTTASDFEGSIIGNTDLLSITYNSGIQGTANAVYNMYVTDLNFAAGHNISDVQGIMISDVGAGTGDNAQGANAAVGFADIEGTPALQESNRNKFLIPIGRKAIKQYNIAGDTDTASVSYTHLTLPTIYSV